MACYPSVQDYFYDQILLPAMKAHEDGDAKRLREILEFAGYKYVELNAFGKGFEEYAKDNGVDAANTGMPVAEYVSKYVQPHMEMKDWKDCVTVYSDPEAEKPNRESV